MARVNRHFLGDTRAVNSSTYCVLCPWFRATLQTPPRVRAGRGGRSAWEMSCSVLFVKRLFLTSQLLIIDGQQLRSDPATVMDEVQKFLGVSPHYNYSAALT